MLSTWIKGNYDDLTVSYSSYFKCFFAMFKVLDIESHKTVEKFHETCIKNIMRRIRTIDKTICQEKYKIYQQFELEDCSIGVKDAKKDDSSDKEPASMRFQKSEKQIHDKVENWQGEYPFSGLLNRYTTIEDTLQMISDL